ncbi:MAG TPA: Mpo1-like protein [Burkholderiaceae bacterium]|jgi:uncharacterized membrane protein YGL010W
MENANQRQVVKLLAKYSESHLNPANEMIHCICVPAIVLSFLGLIWSVHPLLALAVTIASLLYYVSLSITFAFAMLLMSSAMLWLLEFTPPAIVLPGSVFVFVVAWIGQFIGHRIEGKKPSFFDDLRFLLIGPLFVLGVLFRRLHISY